MTLSDMATWILSKLADEAGSSSWWTSTQVKGYINEIYRDTSLSFDCCSIRDATTNTVVGTARYVIPKPTGIQTIKKIIKVSYDETIEGTLDFYTIEQLDSINPRWRGLDSGTPWGVYFERGDENLAVTTVPKCGAIKSLAFDYYFVPTELTDLVEPYEPFKDGIILKDGVMSLCLALAGGGRDLDRSDYYFNMFISRFSQFTKHKSPVWRGLRSVEDSTTIGGVRLPSHYPRYDFNG